MTEGESMKNIKQKLFNGEGAKFSLLVSILALFSLGFGCTGSFNTGNTNSETTNKVEDNQKTNSNLAVNAEKNSNSNIETSNTETSNNDSAEKPDENVEKADASTLKIPSEAQLQEMAKETMLNFDKALKDDDFSGFYETLSKAWQKETSPAALKQGYKVFKEKKSDFSQIKDMEANFTGAAEIKQEVGFDMLNFSGKYTTSPLPTKFLMKYIPEGSEWKLAYLSVDTKP